MGVYIVEDPNTHNYISIVSKNKDFYITYETKEIKLGDFVKYHSYYVKDKNRIFIETNNTYSDKQGLIEWACAIDGEEHIDLEFQGDGIIKPLLRKVDKNGTGFVIDIKSIPTEEYLYSDTTYLYNGAERNIIAKEHRNYVDCIRVAYALGKTRWVPVESLYQ